MAFTHLSLAKGILQGAFSKSDGDLPPVTKDQLSNFHAYLEKIIFGHLPVSSTESIECIAWILSNVAPSTTRSNAFGKYLVKLASPKVDNSAQPALVTYSNTVDPRRARTSQSSESSPRAWYSALDAREDPKVHTLSPVWSVLFLLDATFTALRAAASGDDSGGAAFSTCLCPHAVDLVRRVTPTEGKAALECHQWIESLLNGWKEDDIFGTVEWMKLRETARSQYREWLQWLKSNHPDDHSKLLQQNRLPTALLDLPRHHGNPGDAWHQLPVGNMIPHIKGRQPIEVHRLRPLAISPDEIDPALLAVVNSHIASANRIYSTPKTSPYQGSDSEVELNGLGLRIRRDPRTGKRKVTETYYGHSPQYLERIKKQKTAPAGNGPKSQAITRQQPPPPAPRSFEDDTPPPPPHSASRPPSPTAYQQPPPPPPPTHSTSHLPPPVPLQLPPRPSNWQGPWPPPPPPPGMGSAFPPPPPPQPQMSHSPPQGQPGYPSGNGYDQRGYGDRGWQDQYRQRGGGSRWR